MNFSKKDIDPLDFIIDAAIEKISVTVEDLKKAGFIISQNTPKSELIDPAVDEFIRYLYIIDKHEVCDCFFGEDSEFCRKNSKTLYFKKNGGFKKLYSDLELQIEKEDLEIKKSRVDLELAEKILAEYPKTKWFARIGLLIGIVLALKELYIWLMQSQ